MPKMNVKRMNALAAYLETVPRKRFDMSSWFSGLFGYPFKYNSSEENAMARHSCNTAACIAGHTVLLFVPAEEFEGVRH